MRFGNTKEGPAEDELAEDALHGDGGEEPSQIPLMTGVGRPEGLDGDIDYRSMGEGSKLLNKGTLLILGVVLIAGGALYAMRLSQGDSGPTEEVKKADARIEQLMTQIKSSEAAGGDHKLARGSIEALMHDAEFIIAQLDVDPSKRQVPVEYTKKNPFYLFIDQAATPVAAKPSEDAEAKRLAEQQKQLAAELARFKLGSILPNGRKPVAIIDNKIVQVGEAVGSFKVKEIQKLAVVLESENGTEFTLSIENDPNKPEIRGVKGK